MRGPGVEPSHDWPPSDRGWRGPNSISPTGPLPVQPETSVLELSRIGDQRGGWLSKRESKWLVKSDTRGASLVVRGYESTCQCGRHGSIPGPGGPTCPRSTQAHLPQLLSQCSRTQQVQLLSPCAACPRALAPKQGKPPQWEAREPLCMAARE